MEAFSYYLKILRFTLKKGSIQNNGMVFSMDYSKNLLANCFKFQIQIIGSHSDLMLEAEPTTQLH